MQAAPRLPDSHAREPQQTPGEASRLFATQLQEYGS